jgi:hypothetical protein
MKINRGRAFLKGGCAVTAGWIAVVSAIGRAVQSADIILHTGGSETLITDTRLINAIGGPNAWVQFDFGFATAEELFSGSFLDSVTLTLQGSVPSASAIIATADRSGALFAPLTPGGISLNPNSVTVTEIAFPDINPELSYRHAYSVVAAVPEELLGQNLTFYVDLFDNRNSVDSVAYATAPSIVVPEPATALLAFVGFLFLFGFKWRKK